MAQLAVLVALFVPAMKAQWRAIRREKVAAAAAR
jgi:hypothetical protein